MGYKLGNKIFKTKCEIRKYIKDLLNRHTIGTEIIGDDLIVLKELIDMHPDGIVETEYKISIERNDYGHRHFVLNGEPFSYIKCIKSGNKARNRRCNVLRACRDAIQPDIERFLNKSQANGCYVCEISKESYPRNMVHVDHKFDTMPFIKIVKDYLQKYGYTWENINIRCLDTGGWVLTNVDEFREFHNQMAKLRIINKTLNLSASKHKDEKDKTCKMCELNKPLTEYYKNRNTYVPYCKPCFKSRSNKKYVKASDRPGYTPKKPGRKKIVLTEEQLDIIHSHDGTLAQLAVKLKVSYNCLRTWKYLKKF